MLNEEDAVLNTTWGKNSLFEHRQSYTHHALSILSLRTCFDRFLLLLATFKLSLFWLLTAGLPAIFLTCAFGNHTQEKRLAHHQSSRKVVCGVKNSNTALSVM